MPKQNRRLDISSDPDLPASHKLVALLLLDNENEDDVISTLTLKRIAEILGMQKTHVSRTLSELADWEIIEKFTPTSDQREKWATLGNQVCYRFIGDYSRIADRVRQFTLTEDQ